MNSTLLKQCVAEFVGTFALIFIGVGVIANHANLNSNAGLLAVALAQGLLTLFPGLPSWGAYLIVGILVCIGGGVALFLAQNRFKAATPVAENSLKELEEDAKWLKNPK